MVRVWMEAGSCLMLLFEICQVEKQADDSQS